jgi:hypothetical protein
MRIVSQPLPVDVVQIWWDYFVDGVGVIAGAATAAGVLYAAYTYHRQVDAERRAQASQIMLTLQMVSA